MNMYLAKTKKRMKFSHFLFHNLTTADGDSRNKTRARYCSALLDTLAFP